MNEKLCFIKLIGKETDDYYRYNFLFSKNINDFKIEEDNDYCCLCNTINPISETLNHIVKMKIKLDLIQNNCCFSFNHARIGIVALAWENIDEYEEFPEEGRLFFKFGESLEEIEEKLAIKNILFIN